MGELANFPVERQQQILQARAQALLAAQEQGLPGLGLRQKLQAEGVIAGQITDSRAENIQDFTSVFDKSDVLKPVQRQTDELTNAVAPGVLSIISVIAPRGIILVLREVVWETTGDAFDEARVRFRSRSGAAGGSFLLDAGPFPVSRMLIGDVRSPLTQAFLSLLPFSILELGRVDFELKSFVPANLSSKLTVHRESHYSPFRPAGL